MSAEYEDLEITLLAGEEISYEFGEGSSFLLNERSNADSKLTATIEEINKTYKLRTGQVNKVSFKRIIFRSDVNETFEVRIGTGGQEINGTGAEKMTVAGAVSITGGTISAKPISSTIDTQNDISVVSGAAAAIVGASTTRSRITFQRVDSIVGDMRIGDSGIGASNGLVLKKDGVISLETSDDVYAWQNSGSPMLLAPLEEV